MRRDPEPLGSRSTDITGIARLYRRIWRHVRNVCLFPAAYIVVAPLFIAQHLAGKVWTDVSIVDTFLGMKLIAAVAMALCPIMAFLGWLGIGTYRWLLESVTAGIGWSLFLVAAMSDTLLQSAVAVASGSTGNRSGIKGDFDGSADRVTDYMWLAWAAIAVISGAVAIASTAALHLQRADGNGTLPAAEIARFARIARRERQTYRAYAFGRLPLLAAALALAAGFGYLVNLAQLKIKSVAFPELNYTTFEDSVAILRDHLGKALVALAIEIIAIFIVVAFAYLILRAGWRRVRLSAEAVLAQQHYRPTVYLRSFRDEDAVVTPNSLATRLQLRQARLEEVVVGTLARLGPAVAIGVPGEGTPRLGALRAYYADADWQGAVRRWVGGSRLVVVTAGTSPSVLWELRYLAEHGLFERLLMIIPPDRDATARATRWAAISDAVAGTPWQGSLQAVASLRALCIVFDADGHAHAFEGDARYQSDYEVAVQLAVARLLGGPAEAAAPA